MTNWSFDDIPDQQGRTAIVTGANTGIGFETARMLAQKGADVVLACRSADKGNAAVERLRALKPAGTVSFAPLDLSDLESVAAFATQFATTHARLDLLVNNAGIMRTPMGRTKQGFELQMGTNHLGHFALTQRLLPLLDATKGARVVVVSSIMHKFGKLHLEDLDWKRRSYDTGAAYSESKLANVMFALELQRRLAARGSGTTVVAAHPGVTNTELTRSMSSFVARLNRLITSDVTVGAMPSVRAATDPAVTGGTYWGPANLFETRGPAVQAKISSRAKDEVMQKSLFDESERLTGLTF